MSTITIERVVRGLTIEPDIFRDRQRDERAFDELGEIEQQLVLEISGTADELPAWAYAIYDFDVEFVNATAQRYSNLTKPVFSTGVELTSSTGEFSETSIVLFTDTSPPPVFITPVVRRYKRDDRDVIYGCVIAVGCVNPGAAVAFNGSVHCSFQGFGAPTEYTGGD